LHHELHETVYNQSHLKGIHNAIHVSFLKENSHSNIHIWSVYIDFYKIPWHLATSQKSGHLRPSSKSGAHLPWASYHLVESWQNHVSHPSVMTYQTHLDHVLLELSIYPQPFVESVHVPFLDKHVFFGTWLNSSSTSLPLALAELYSLKRNTPVLATNNFCQGRRCRNSIL
jgi:hypothetical protein